MITVASVPSGHVYVRHVAGPEVDDVVRLPDPRPTPALKARLQHRGYGLEFDDRVVADIGEALEHLGHYPPWRADPAALQVQRRRIADARQRWYANLLDRCA